jgi:hypothetical protein
VVEHHLAKVGVAGSNPVVRSRSGPVWWPVVPPAGHTSGHIPPPNGRWREGATSGDGIQSGHGDTWLCGLWIASASPGDLVSAVQTPAQSPRTEERLDQGRGCAARTDAQAVGQEDRRLPMRLHRPAAYYGKRLRWPRRPALRDVGTPQSSEPEQGIRGRARRMVDQRYEDGPDRARVQEDGQGARRALRGSEGESEGAAQPNGVAAGLGQGPQQA